MFLHKVNYFELWRNNTKLKWSLFGFRPANENDTDLVLFQNNSSECISQLGHQGGIQIIQLTEDECFTRPKIATQIFSSIGISLVSFVFTYIFVQVLKGTFYSQTEDFSGDFITLGVEKVKMKYGCETPSES